VGPGQDFRFLHDGRGYLVFDVETDLARGLLTTVLYGEPLDRKVEVDGPHVSNLSPPAPSRTLAVPGLAAGEREQVTWAREGADVALERRVLDGSGRTVAHDSWLSRYAPAGDVVLVGR
jgi:hypothetical protein